MQNDSASKGPCDERNSQQIGVSRELQDSRNRSNRNSAASFLALTAELSHLPASIARRRDMSPDPMRLHTGEMTLQTVRSVQAVLCPILPRQAPETEQAAVDAGQ
jgi:hypothetical protein